MARDIKTASQFFTAMKDYLIANSNITDLNIGSNLRTLLEAISLVCGDINLDWFIALDKQTQESIYDSFDFERKIGNKSGGFLTFFIQEVSTSDITIPAGTMIDWNGFFAETAEEGIITAGDLDSGEISALFTVPSSQTNIDVNTINTLVSRGSILDKPNDIDYAINETAFSGGTDEESDEERIERFRIYIQGLTRSTVFGIEAGALSVEGVRSVNTLENIPTAGWITIIAEEGDGTLSTATKEEIEKVINGDRDDPINYPGYKAAGVKVEVKAPILNNITFSIEVNMLNSTPYDETELINIVKAATERYVNSLKLGYDVILSEVITAIQNANETIYDVFVNFPANNVTINSGELARTNSSLISVAVNNVNF